MLHEMTCFSHFATDQLALEISNNQQLTRENALNHFCLLTIKMWPICRVLSSLRHLTGLPSRTLAGVQRSSAGVFSPSAHHTESHTCLPKCFVNQHLFPVVLCPYVTRQKQVESLGHQQKCNCRAAKPHNTLISHLYTYKYTSVRRPTNRPKTDSKKLHEKVKQKRSCDCLSLIMN